MKKFLPLFFFLLVVLFTFVFLAKGRMNKKESDDDLFDDLDIDYEVKKKKSSGNSRRTRQKKDIQEKEKEKVKKGKLEQEMHSNKIIDKQIRTESIRTPSNDSIIQQGTPHVNYNIINQTDVAFKNNTGILFFNDDTVKQCKKYWDAFIHYVSFYHSEVLKIIPYPFDILLCVCLGYLCSSLLFLSSKIKIPPRSESSYDKNINNMDKKFNEVIDTLVHDLSNQSSLQKTPQKEISNEDKTILLNKFNQMNKKLCKLRNELPQNYSIQSEILDSICEIQLKILQQLN